MGEGYLWKPQSESTGNLTVLLPTDLRGNLESVSLYDPKGTLIEEGDFRHDNHNGNRPTYDFSQPGGAYNGNYYVQATTSDGQTLTFPGAGAGRSDGGDSGGGGGFGGGTNVGGVAYPNYLGGFFPEFQPVSFPTIPPADFQMTDPQQFAEKFGDFNRQQLDKNFSQAGRFALDALDQELRGLQEFTPAAAAIQRGQVALDNPFNQLQRTSQLDSALPGVRNQLRGQGQRAETYARGELPFADRAFELTQRSRAADQATFAGFGAGSGQAAKLSDLMSAEARLGVAQFGEGLLTSNIGTRSALELAPTEYANAGQQVKVTPEVGAGRLTYQGLGAVNEATLISPGAALQSEIQQQEFGTNLEQRTNEFNSTGTFDARKFNSVNSYAAQLGAFNYEVAFASQKQAADQAQLNMAGAINTFGINSTNQNAGLQAGQNAQTLQSTVQGIGTLPGLSNTISQLFNPSESPDTPDQSEPVGRTQVDTSPSQTPQTQQPTLPGTQVPNISFPSGGTPDASAPSTFRLAPNTAAPAGFSPVAQTSGGERIVASNAAYAPELDRVARSGGFSQGSINIGPAAAADRALSSAAALSYVPQPQFKQVALSGGGNPIYSLPAASARTDYTAGQGNLANVALSLRTLGINDPAAMSEISRMAGIVSSPEVLTGLDKTYSTEGSDAVAREIISQTVGNRPDISQPEVQQAVFGAHRIADMWGGLSPYQKSMALTSLAQPIMRNKLGRDIGNDIIPGSNSAVGGALRVKDALSLTMQGQNGHALARNWTQLSAIQQIAGGAQGAQSTAQLASHIGLLGMGPQGASVPLQAGELKRKGAVPAPEFGVGASHFNSAQDIPKSYQVVARTDTGVVALPKNLTGTSPFQVQNGSAPRTSEAIGQIASGSHPAQKMWKKNNWGMVRGSAGGSAMISGLDIMRNANPNLLGGIAAYSLYSNTLT